MTKGKKLNFVFKNKYTPVLLNATPTALVYVGAKINVLLVKQSSVVNVLLSIHCILEHHRGYFFPF